MGVRHRRQRGGLALAAWLLVGCSMAFEAPPVEVEHRESLVGIGRIVRITNRHSEPLTAIEVRIENPNGDVKNHALEALEPGRTVELGWKKLDGFEVVEGAEVTLRATGFALPFVAELATDASSS